MKSWAGDIEESVLACLVSSFHLHRSVAFCDDDMADGVNLPWSLIHLSRDDYLRKWCFCMVFSDNWGDKSIALNRGENLLKFVHICKRIEAIRS